jgi:hypothetical protein
MERQQYRAALQLLRERVANRDETVLGDVGFALSQLRLQIQKLRFARVDLRLVNRRVDLGQQFPLGHGLAIGHMQLFHLSGHLRADIDELKGLQRSNGSNRIFDITDGNFLRHRWSFVTAAR